MKKYEKSNDLITTRNTHSMEKNEKRWKKDMKKKAKKKKKMEKINDTITTRNTHSIKNIWIKSHMLSNYILFKV